MEGAGGDFYDVVALDSEVFGYFVADVSGHGVSAAFLTSAIKALLRQYTGPLFSPEDTMRGIDAVMRQMLGEEQYLTACYANLNRRTGRLSVVSAGHPPVIVVSASGKAQTLQMDSDPLGIFSSLVIQRKEVQVSPGDRFYLYTDGLIESSPGGGRGEGLERLVASCVLHRTDPLPEAAVGIAADIQFGAAARQDDLLLLAVEVTQMKAAEDRTARVELPATLEAIESFCAEFRRWRAVGLRGPGCFLDGTAAARSADQLRGARWRGRSTRAQFPVCCGPSGAAC